jgi:hypothetical protein
MGPEERKRVVPRVVMFGGKAFATYAQAKRIVKLVTDVGSVVNNDPDIGNLLKVIIPQALKLISLSLTIDPLSLSWCQLPMFLDGLRSSSLSRLLDWCTCANFLPSN